jgi:hypothetical protein
VRIAQSHASCNQSWSSWLGNLQKDRSACRSPDLYPLLFLRLLYLYTRLPDTFVQHVRSFVSWGSLSKLDICPAIPRHSLSHQAHRYSTTMTDRAQPLRLGSTAPNFQAETTQGKIDFHGKATPSLAEYPYANRMSRVHRRQLGHSFLSSRGLHSRLHY